MVMDVEAAIVAHGLSMLDIEILQASSPTDRG